jgi:RPA family protein
VVRVSADDQGGAGRREVAYRLFAAEFEDADFSYSESDEERAPNYVVTPTGARVNRLFVVGVLTEVEQAGEDILRARVVDPTGAFVVYAGQYQPEAQAFFDRAGPPAFVAVTGKARTFQPDDSDVVYTSVRPENVNEVTAETRDRWNVGTARQTIDRVSTMAAALARDERGDELRTALDSEGVDAGLAAGIPLAIDHYGTTATYLNAVRELSSQVAEVVAGEREEADSLTADPDSPGDVDPAVLADVDVSTSAGGDSMPGDATTETTATAAGGESASADSTSEDSAGEAADEAETPDTGTAEDATGEAASEDTSTADVSTESGADSDETPSPDESLAGESTTADAGLGAGAGVDDESEAMTDESDTGAAGSDDIGDFEPGEFELDEEEREEVQEQYGTEFKSGTEVDEPGEADIETPDPEEIEADAASDEPAEGTATDESATEAATAEPESASATTESAETEPETTATDESIPETDTGDAEADTADADTGDAEVDTGEADADVDIETAVMEAMEDNDDGDGAPEAAIVEDVTARLGVDESEVTDALQDALMGGQCYEPGDGVYKSI